MKQLAGKVEKADSMGSFEIKKAENEATELKAQENEIKLKEK